MLAQAGVNEECRKLIPDIVDSCPHCLKWARPLPASVASVNVPSAFNEEVECDIMFHADYEIWHMMDRATRWHAAMIIPNHEVDTLIDAIDQLWVKTHGAMKFLVCDGEKAIKDSLLTAVYFDQRGIQYNNRGVDQHTRGLDRRTQLFRLVLNTMDSQLEAEGLISIPFKHRLSDAVFAGNALISVNRSTPYNAVYGRCPHLLPDLRSVADDEDDGQDGVEDEEGEGELLEPRGAVGQLAQQIYRPGMDPLSSLIRRPWTVDILLCVTMVSRSPLSV